MSSHFRPISYSGGKNVQLNVSTSAIGANDLMRIELEDIEDEIIH